MSKVRWRKVISGNERIMTVMQAKETLDAMQYDAPYSSREEFIHAVACVSVVHRKEMQRTGSLRMPLFQLLLNATTGAKCGWYFNNIVHRRTVPPAHLPLLPSGTTANEALHNELAQAMRQTIRPSHANRCRDHMS